MRQRCLQAGRSKPHKWTEAEENFIREYAPGHLIAEIQEEWTKRFGAEAPTASAIQNRKTILGVKSGIRAGCFKKGFTPWNKGKSWDEYMSDEGRSRCATTQYKKGDMPWNGARIPVGYERVDAKDGFTYVKIAERPSALTRNDNFKLKHHIVWEQTHGCKVPEEHVILFADHDRTNFDPDNLVAVSRSLLSVINHRGLKYADRKTLEAAIDIAKAYRAIHSAKCRPRQCKTCDNVFTPRYPNQRTCDECLGRSDAPQNRV